MVKKNRKAPQPSKRKQTLGLPPGTPVYTGEFRDAGMTVQVIDFDQDTVAETDPREFSALGRFVHTPTVTWVNVTGLDHIEAVKQVCEAFGVHPLVIEDIAAVNTRPKAEEFSDQLFVVSKTVRLRTGEEGHPEVTLEHVPIVVGDHYVLTFQETPGDVFDGVRERIRTGRKRLRESGTDYLLYVLLDAMGDQIFNVLESLGVEGERLEDAILLDPKTDHVQKTYLLRRQLMRMRRLLPHFRDTVSALIKAEPDRIAEDTRPFLRDLYDHLVEANDQVEFYRDMVMGLVDLYMNSTSHRMNEVMHVLTVVGTIFIPLTFIAGIYGMNFDHMPELHWQYGYPGVWVLMGLTTAGMLGYFRWRKWL